VTDFGDINVVPNTTAERLTERQLLDYRNHREDLIEWLLFFGKDPETADGYARTTVKTRAYRMDQFYRWVWDERGGYTTDVTHDDGDAYLRYLAKQNDYGHVHKDNSRKALQMLFKWRHHQHGLGKWDPALSFSTGSTSTNPRDYLTVEERRAIREAALEYGSIPSPRSLSATEHDRWKAYLAQRFEKPKADVDKSDWDRANNWKIPSLVWTSLDAGLRPIEVERAVTSWVDVENAVLRIPKEQSSKNTENWIVGIRQRTADALDKWLDQRCQYERYDDTDALWLTREGNPYGSSALRRVLHRLCDTAEIETDDRQMSWYAIRHSVGTYMTREEDLAATQSQLRHKNPETTMKYDQVPVEDRRDALDRMG
jgi:site-specific recombinase XerD